MKCLIVALLLISSTSNAARPEYKGTDAEIAKLQAQAAMECISEDAPKASDGKYAESRYVARVQSCLESSPKF